MAQANNEKITANPGELSLKDLILRIREWRKYLRSKWKTILVAAIIGVILGLAFSYFKKPDYTAELSFAMDDESSGGAAGGLGAAAGLASQFGVDLGTGSNNGAFSPDNMPELMKARSMVENTLLTPVDVKGKKQTLAELYMSFRNFRKRWEDDPELKNIDFPPGLDRSKFTLLQDSVLGLFSHEIIKKDLSVDKSEKKSTIITVKVKSSNELFSKLFTEILAKTVSNFYIETKTKKSSKNVYVLQKLTDSVREQLNSAITGVASTSDVNPNPNPALQILRVPSQHHQVDVEANGAMLTELVKNLELSKINLRKETPLIQIIDKPILPLDNDKVGKIAGSLLGALICVVITVVFLIVKLFFKNVINE